MELGEIFDYLSSRELSQTGLVVEGAFPEENYPQLINFINMGVLELHKRFPLIETEVILQLYETITYYQFHYDYAETNDVSAKSPKYILDTVDRPYNADRKIKIVSVYAEDGREYWMNPAHVDGHLSELLTAYTPKQLTLQIPNPSDEMTVSVICRAAPLKIPSTTTDLTTEVELPDILLEALLAFVGESYFLPLNAQKKESVIYPNKFEEACARVDTANLINSDQIYGMNNFQRGQWP